MFVCVYSAFVEVYWSFTLLPLSYLKLGASEECLCNMLLSFLLSSLLFLMLVLLLFLFFTAGGYKQNLVFYLNTCTMHLLWAG